MRQLVCSRAASSAGQDLTRPRQVYPQGWGGMAWSLACSLFQETAFLKPEIFTGEGQSLVVVYKTLRGREGCCCFLCGPLGVPINQERRWMWQSAERHPREASRTTVVLWSQGLKQLPGPTEPLTVLSSYHLPLFPRLPLLSKLSPQAQYLQLQQKVRVPVGQRAGKKGPIDWG